MRVLKWLLDTRRGDDADAYADVATMFGRTLVYDTIDIDGDVIRVLDVEGTWQSGSYVDARWAELAFAYHRRIANVVFGHGASPARMLVLGGGALSLPKHAVAHHEGLTVDVVEIDRAITELAHRYFMLDRLTPVQARRMRVTHADGAAFLARAAQAGATYDVIVNDAFAAVNAPASLTSEQAATWLHRLVGPDGLYIANVVSALVGTDATSLVETLRTLGGTFAHVCVIPLGTDTPTVPDNNVVIATDGTCAFEGAIPAAELVR